jgi:hypothetical protein
MKHPRILGTGILTIFLSCPGVASAQFDDFDGGGGFGGMRKRNYGGSPFSPNVQNQQGQDWAPNWGGSPFSPDVQNNQAGGWNDWDDGGFHNPQWQNHQHWNQNQWHNQQGYWNQPQYSYSAPPAPQIAYSNLPIGISMPYGESGLCSYSLSSGGQSWNYTISSGRSQTFNEDRAWQITFDRGNGLGTSTYALRPGEYRFRQSSRGWELYRSN